MRLGPAERGHLFDLARRRRQPASPAVTARAEAARNTVGMLRMAAGRRPHDRELVRLAGELSVASEPFRRL